MAKITWDDRANNGADSAVSASIFNDTKTSVNSLYDVINARLGTTSSAAGETVIFDGSVDINNTLFISGNILPDVGGGETTSSFNLGSPTQAWKELYVSDGSINFVDGDLYQVLPSKN